jgi:chromosome segregation ATPase
MTDTTTPSHVTNRNNIMAEIASLDEEIREKRHEIMCLQEEIDDLEIERSEWDDKLDDLDDEEA